MAPAPTECPNADAALFGHISSNINFVCTIVAHKYLSKLGRFWETQTTPSRPNFWNVPPNLDGSNVSLHLNRPRGASRSKRKSVNAAP